MKSAGVRGKYFKQYLKWKESGTLTEQRVDQQAQVNNMKPNKKSSCGKNVVSSLIRK